MSSITFKVLSKFKIIKDEVKYGDISPWGILKHSVKTIVKLLLYKYCYSSFILEPLNFKFLRAVIWRCIGIRVGHNVKIGHSVVLDYGNTELISIGNNVSITDCCILLCHRKDISNYRKGDNSAELPFLHLPIKLNDGVNLGKGTIVMPGVEIGEGSVIGAGSVVTKNIPAWSVAAGCPCRVIKNIEERDTNE